MLLIPCMVIDVRDRMIVVVSHRYGFQGRIDDSEEEWGRPVRFFLFVLSTARGFSQNWV
jgi:hypothetical protein